VNAHPNASALAKYTSGVLRARAAYEADKHIDADRIEARAAYERARYRARKEAA
jgi:hypothetical protein